MSRFTLSRNSTQKENMKILGNFQTVCYLRSKLSNPFGKYFNYNNYQLTLSFNCPFEYLKRVEDYFAN